MEKKFRFIKKLMYLILTVFTLVVIYNVVDYLRNTDKYIYSSAPWYTLSEICGIISAVLILILIIIRVLVKR